ncbi:hypothetical protein K4K60_000688 [Colletotrichum sp. SAR11_57]|nr:hypothetical protein K4K60_000688 [Colletotrichum sp. SAR11_57]
MQHNHPAQLLRFSGMVVSQPDFTRRFNAPPPLTTSVTMSDFLSSTEFDKFLAELDSNAYAIDMGFMDLLDPIGYDDGHVGDGGLGPAAPLDP